MNAIFTCPKCQWTGDAPNERTVREHLGGPEDHFYLDCDVFFCPKCGNDQLDHASACDECHKRPAVKGADECQECLDAMARLEQRVIAEFQEANDAFDFYRMRGMRGYSITAGINLMYAVRRIA